MKVKTSVTVLNQLNRVGKEVRLLVTVLVKHLSIMYTTQGHQYIDYFQIIAADT